MPSAGWTEDAFGQDTKPTVSAPEGTQDDVCDYVLPRGHPSWNIRPRIHSQSQLRDHVQPRRLPDLPRSWTGCADVPKLPSAALAVLLCGGSLLRCGPPLRWGVTLEELSAALHPDSTSPRQDWSPAGPQTHSFIPQTLQVPGGLHEPGVLQEMATLLYPPAVGYPPADMAAEEETGPWAEV